jgi:hypothetical protein
MSQSCVRELAELAIDREDPCSLAWLACTDASEPFDNPLARICLGDPPGGEKSWGEHSFWRLAQKILRRRETRTRTNTNTMNASHGDHLLNNEACRKRNRREQLPSNFAMARNRWARCVCTRILRTLTTTTTSSRSYAPGLCVQVACTWSDHTLMFRELLYLPGNRRTETDRLPTYNIRCASACASHASNPGSSSVIKYPGIRRIAP